MSKGYTLEQLKRFKEYCVEKNLISLGYETQKFLDLIYIRSLRLPQKRNEKGEFIKEITNEDILEAIKNK